MTSVTLAIPTATAASAFVSMGVTSSAPSPRIATSFVRKLYRLLDHERPEVIGWDRHGTTFSIRDEAELGEHVLPRYYRMQLESFRQQLVEHGFRRLVTAGSKETYHHKCFIRGEPSKLSCIVRATTRRRRRTRKFKPDIATTRSEGCGTLPILPAATTNTSSEAAPLFTFDNDFSFSKWLAEDETYRVPPVPTVTASPTSASTPIEDVVRLLANQAMRPCWGMFSLAQAAAGPLAAAFPASQSPILALASSVPAAVTDPAPRIDVAPADLTLNTVPPAISMKPVTTAAPEPMVESAEFSEDLLDDMLQWLDMSTTDCTI